MSLAAVLQRFFSQSTTLRPGDRVLVAFSGGPDSTALLWGLRQAAPALGVELAAAHLDHGLDPDSARRAEIAGRLAATAGVALVTERLEPSAEELAGESLEAWARRRRYRFLESTADALGARFIATAHHADDQAETVLLRLLFGSGLAGLAGIRPVRGRVVRPLLDQRRRELRQSLAGSGLEPAVDPTNASDAARRNRVRRTLLPALLAEDARLVERLCSLASAAGAAGDRVDRVLAPALALRSSLDEPGVELDRRAFETLAGPLRAPALALAHRAAGARYPMGAAARRELERQLHERGRVGCDGGDGWRWEGDSRTLRLVGRKPKIGNFTYTLKVPGGVEVPDLGLKISIARGDVEAWMFRGRPDRVGLASSMRPGTRVVIRNRRPGDRVQPLGSRERLRLKDLLIDRRIARRHRDRLPLLVIDDEIAWVPGVTVGERFRLGGERSTWIARLEPADRARGRGSAR